ncbi:MAG: DMT family transporter [Deltaproteobacteria bacterium]|nr:DMT family transporter [Deltaproteobacteria bacterium]
MFALAPVFVARSASSHAWLWPAVATTVLWGVWGAFADAPEAAGFPATLGFVAWVIALLPVAAAAWRTHPGPLPRSARAIVLGFAGGLPAGLGNLLLFFALRTGPASLVFPLVSLYPIITVLLGALVLRERVPRAGWLGIGLCTIALPLLVVQTGGGDATGTAWIAYAIIVCLLWGVQAFLWKLAEPLLLPQALTVYLAAANLLLIPFAVLITTSWQHINWGWGGLGLAMLVQALNAIGVLTFAHALARGPSVVVVPLTALAPLITVVLSLLVQGSLPSLPKAAGIALATCAGFILASKT